MNERDSHLLLGRDGHCLRVTINRPDKRNALAPATVRELIDAFDAARTDPSVRVVLLTGAGSVFSAGGDLSAMRDRAGDGDLARPRGWVELLETMHRVGKPIVAMVNGHALAGGCGLVAACDVVYASDRASFGTTEIRVGLWPMIITAEIARTVGRKRALELMLTGRRVSAAEAEDMGLITRAIAHDELESQTRALVAELAERSPAVVSLGLRAFYESQDLPHAEALRYLQGRLSEVMDLDDAREGLDAFLEKRSPRWTGR